MTAVISFILGVIFGAFIMKRDFTFNINKVTNDVTKQPEPLTELEIEAMLKMESERTLQASGNSQESLNENGLYEAIAQLTSGAMDLEDLI